MNTTQQTESPEVTGRYTCPACGERHHFLGYDRDGFPGDDCTCGQSFCICAVELRQPFTVVYDEEGTVKDVDYDLHEGGGIGAEIGQYDRITCLSCGTTVWEEVQGG